jgi:hypothetical protein
MTQDIASLSRRLDLLERSNRTLRRGLAASLTAVAAVFAVAATSEAPRGRSDALSAVDLTVEELKVKQLELLDSADKPRARLAMDGANKAAFTILDLEGKPRIELSCDDLNALILLKDLELKNRAGIAVDSFPHLMLHDADQKPRIHASVGVTGAPSIVLLDRSGKFNGGMGLNGSGKPWVKPLIELEADVPETEKDKEK